MSETDSVETQSDFAQAMVDDGVLEWLNDSAPGESVPDEPADTGDAVERPRDDKGRFLPTNVEETPEQPEATPPENEVEETEAEATEEEDDYVLDLDEGIQAILERYDGDIGKALRALGDKESMVGRQANEVGELRSELQAMRQALEQGFQQQTQPQYYGPYQNDLDENPEQLLYEALERGDAQTSQLALHAWGEIEPFKANLFLFSQAQAQSQASQPQAPTPQETGPGLEEAMAQVVERHPDVEKYLPALGEAAKEFPTLRSFMEHGTPAQKAQAFEELLVITKSRPTGDTSEAIKRVTLRTQEEVRKEKAEAAVVSATNQSAATAGSKLDEFYRAFDEATGQGPGAEDWITRSND